jgi:hypothetical protein
MAETIKLRFKYNTLDPAIRAVRSVSWRKSCVVIDWEGDFTGIVDVTMFVWVEEQDVITVDHTITLLSVLVARQDIKYDSAGSWIHWEFKFETVLPLVSLLLWDLKVSAWVHMLKLKWAAIYDNFTQPRLLDTLVVLLLLIHTSLKHLKVAGSHFSFLSSKQLR